MASLLIDFTKIGPRTSLFIPEKPVSGQLIVLCTWLGAARKHISKYVALHKEITPGAHILLIESNVPIIVSSYAKQREAIKPAVSAVLDTLAECDIGSYGSGKTEAALKGQTPLDNSRHGSEATATSKPEPKILLHVFSNGGTTTVTQLLLVLKDHRKAPLPLAGFLCDSCPAKGTYWRSYDAMVLSLPKDPATSSFCALACHCILLLLYAWLACGYENPASLQRRTMLDEEAASPSLGEGIQGSGGKKLRGCICYFYSKADRMCLWSDVKHHADEARMLGWDVREELFEGSGHCAHLAQDERKYADAVKGVWESR